MQCWPKDKWCAKDVTTARKIDTWFRLIENDRATCGKHGRRRSLTNLHIATSGTFPRDRPGTREQRGEGKKSLLFCPEPCQVLVSHLLFTGRVARPWPANSTSRNLGLPRSFAFCAKGRHSHSNRWLPDRRSNFQRPLLTVDAHPSRLVIAIRPKAAAPGSRPQFGR